jgi:hypothetical protein
MGRSKELYEKIYCESINHYAELELLLMQLQEYLFYIYSLNNG